MRASGLEDKQRKVVGLIHKLKHDREETVELETKRHECNPQACSRDEAIAELRQEVMRLQKQLADSTTVREECAQRLAKSTSEIAILTELVLEPDVATHPENQQAQQGCIEDGQQAHASKSMAVRTALLEYREALEAAVYSDAAGEQQSRLQRIVRSANRKLRKWLRNGKPAPAILQLSKHRAESQDLVELLRQSSLFDATWYLSRYPDVRNSSQDPAEHYLLQGSALGFDPGPDFGTVPYLIEHADVRLAGINPLVHFLRHGEEEGRVSFTVAGKVVTSHARDLAAIRESKLFDSDWYSSQYDDVAQSGLDPADHYLRVGGRLRRNPSARFCSDYYTSSYPDVEYSGMNPLLHFLRHGREEARRCMPPTDRPRVATTVKGSRKERPNQTYREYQGYKSLVPKARTILVCAHVAGDHLFGAERSLLDIVDGLVASGYNVIATIPRTGNSEYLKALCQRCISVVSFRYDWWRRGQPLDNEVVAVFAQVISEKKIDAVHVNTIMLREPLAASRRMGVPCLAHVRELIEYDVALREVIGESSQRITEQVLQNADWIIANSMCTGQAFPKVEAVRIIPNTVDVNAFSHAPRDKQSTIKFGLVSSNLPKKGILDFVAVARLVLQTAPKARFVLIGPENEHTQKLRTRQANDNDKMPANVDFAGYRDHPAEAMAEIDVLLNLSNFQESFGRTVLEAMAAGMPVIVYDWGALPELVVPGETGYVVPYKDIAAVASKVTALCRDTRKINSMGAAGKQRALSIYDKPCFAESIGNIYKDIFENADANQTPALTLPARSTLPLQSTIRKPRIAYFLWHFPVPSETFVLNELRILVAQGHDVQVFCKNSPYKDFTPDFPITWTCVKDVEELARQLSDTKREIVHSHFTYPTVTEMVWPACKAAGVPFTFIAHAQDIFRYRNDETNQISEIGRSKWCVRVLVPSHFHRDYVEARGVPARKLLINPNGIDPDLYVGGGNSERASRSKRSICAIHRFTEKKGLKHLVRAGKALAAEGIAIHIYGYGELESAYRDLIEAEALDNVFVHGAVKSRDEMLAIFRQHDLFACPSVRAVDGDMDGIPTVLMEAMASGMPVITTSASGIPDLAQDEVTGIVCDADPASIAESVRRFYAMPDAQVQAIMEDAQALIWHKFDAKRLTMTLLRLWQQKTIDLMIVSWNNLPQLQEVIRRIRKFTTMPHHLLICDNGSDPEVTAFLCDTYAQSDNTTVIFNRSNSYVGPGTNICLEHGNSDYAVYVCGKEGFVLDYGWERSLIDYMDTHPEVGLAGTQCHSPSYLTGADYPTGIPLFDKFRNQRFAADNPHRKFAHVQGGFFVIRRAMYDAIGGFNPDVPHSYTDVEYSYYAESEGWKLGSPPQLLALFNKSRPGLFSRIDESIAATHPPVLEDLPLLDRIVACNIAHCNVCGWHGDSFELRNGLLCCRQCASRPSDRTLYRYLAESTLVYRRLPAIGVNIGPAMADIWKQQFQGELMTTADFQDLFDGGHKLSVSTGSIKLAYLDCKFASNEMGRQAFDELDRVMADNGMILVRGAEADLPSTFAAACHIQTLRATRFSSAVVRYDYVPLISGSRCEVSQCVS